MREDMVRAFREDLELLGRYARTTLVGLVACRGHIRDPFLDEALDEDDESLCTSDAGSAATGVEPGVGPPPREPDPRDRSSGAGSGAPGSRSAAAEGAADGGRRRRGKRAGRRHKGQKHAEGNG